MEEKSKNYQFCVCKNADTVMAWSHEKCENCRAWNPYGRNTCDDPGSKYWGQVTSPSFVCDRFNSN